MNSPRWLAGVAVFLLSAAAGLVPAAAQLPSLDNPPWIGYFAVFANKHFRLGMTTQGKITLTPCGDKGEAVAKSLAIPIEISVEETRPDGQSTVKQLKPESLESAQHATAQLEQTVIRGKVTGGASFEVGIGQNRGVISLGGRLLDRGSLKKYPLRFSIRVKFPAAYPFEQQVDKKQARAFQKKLESDHIDLTWTDGKRKKQAFDQAVDASSKELNGPGITTAEVEISAYKGHKFLFTASPDSALTLTNEQTAPLHKGFAIRWLPNAAKDPAGKARLSFQVR
jgi:hypothetical protein